MKLIRVDKAISQQPPNSESDITRTGERASIEFLDARSHIDTIVATTRQGRLDSGLGLNPNQGVNHGRSIMLEAQNTTCWDDGNGTQ